MWPSTVIRADRNNLNNTSTRRWWRTFDRDRWTVVGTWSLASEKNMLTQSSDRGTTSCVPVHVDRLHQAHRYTGRDHR